jgi:hypothetical protein
MACITYSGAGGGSWTIASISPVAACSASGTLDCLLAPLRAVARVRAGGLRVDRENMLLTVVWIEVGASEISFHSNVYVRFVHGKVFWAQEL